MFLRTKVKTASDVTGKFTNHYDTHVNIMRNSRVNIFTSEQIDGRERERKKKCMLLKLRLDLHNRRMNKRLEATNIDVRG